jgi:hypothetical protein
VGLLVWGLRLLAAAHAAAAADAAWSTRPLCTALEVWACCRVSLASGKRQAPCRPRWRHLVLPMAGPVTQAASQLARRR